MWLFLLLIALVLMLHISCAAILANLIITSRLSWSWRPLAWMLFLMELMVILLVVACFLSREQIAWTHW